MVDSSLLNFIIETIRRGYSKLEIKTSLLSHGWSEKSIESAFIFLESKPKYQNQISLFLSDEIISTLEKRAKKNLFTLSEQIEDILRRSCMIKKSTKTEKLDDFLITCFSRKKK